MKNVYDTIFRLYLYADTCKIIHYTCDKTPIHELADTIRTEIINFTDEFAEQFFGYHGKPKKSELTIKLSVKEEDNLTSICQTVINIVEPLRTEFSKKEKLSGLVSLIDDFKGTMNKHKFLSTFDRLS